MSSDLTFVTNEPGNSLRDRFTALLTDDTRFFDCLVGYFYISGRLQNASEVGFATFDTTIADSADDTDKNRIIFWPSV
jgi:hypothetical protein